MIGQSAPIGEPNRFVEHITSLARRVRELELSAAGGGTQWNDLRVPFNSAKLGPLNPPSFVQWRDNGAGSTGVFGWEFAGNRLEQVYFDAQLPHGYKEGTPLSPHVHFVFNNAPTVGQTIRFGLEYTAASGNTVYPLTNIIESTYTITAADAQYRHTIVGLPEIDGTDLLISAMLGCRFYRDGGVDTYTAGLVVSEFDFHFVVESLGSLEPFSKP